MKRGPALAISRAYLWGGLLVFLHVFCWVGVLTWENTPFFGATFAIMERSSPRVVATFDSCRAGVAGGVTQTSDSVPCLWTSSCWCSTGFGAGRSSRCGWTRSVSSARRRRCPSWWRTVTGVTVGAEMLYFSELVCVHGRDKLILRSRAHKSASQFDTRP